MADVFEINATRAVNFAPSNEVEEVIQNVAVLLGTMKYSVPYDRTLGLQASFLDATSPIAQARFNSEIVTLLKEREPRAQVIEVRYRRDEINGRLFPTVRITVNV